MRRGVVAFAVLTLIGIGITGCGLSRHEQREPWRLQAEQACLSQKLARPTAYMAQMSEIVGPGTCGMTHPFKVAAFADGTVGLTTRATLACPMIPRIDTWLNEIVQPAAAAYLGSAVVEVRSGSYSCRPRNNQRGARLSEHSFGNAVDVMGFRLADGREITVVKGWRGSAGEQDFLRESFVGACQLFNTVLGPGADAFHYDHFHLDLARHDPRGERRVCKPVIKFTPRSQEADTSPQPRPEPARPRQSEPPVEIDEEDDPFVVDSGATSRASPRPPVAQIRTPSTLPRPATAYMGSQPAPSRSAASQPAPAMADPPSRAVPPRALSREAAGSPSLAGAYAPTRSVPQPPPSISRPREPMVLQPQVFSGHTLY